MKLIVPAYAYPTPDHPMWCGLSTAREAIGAVVVNPASGAGTIRDPIWVDAVSRLAWDGIPAIGYLDLAYGDRRLPDLLAEAQRWQDWYGISGFFLDQVRSDRDDQLGSLTTGLRSLGEGPMVGNPGCPASGEITGVLDVVVDCEGTGHVESGSALPDRIGRAWILHSLGRGAWRSELAAAAASGVGLVWLTEQTGPNPYDRLPQFWEQLVGELAAERPGAVPPHPEAQLVVS